MVIEREFINGSRTIEGLVHFIAPFRHAIGGRGKSDLVLANEEVVALGAASGRHLC